ncbi:MAG: NAD-dependent epimerase/dehydratase family protein [Deltaproteobacteria bacterium]|nr:NAD-dependent epimerase/dehydratase family protein [Deltaproteobacteria bacterium]
MLVLVSGAAGFIGSNLCQHLLDNGFEVRGVDSFSDYYPRSIKEQNISSLSGRAEFDLVEADLVEADMDRLLDGVEAVFHLAAQAGVRNSWGQEFKMYSDNNILATQRLLEAAKNINLKRFIFASSSSIYGESLDQPTREDSALRPVSPYGVSKAAGDHLCRLYHLNFGLPTVCLRYFTVYGPRQRPDMAFHRFLKAIAQGQDIRLFGDGSQSRDFTYVGDAVSGTVAALKGRPGEAYNLGGGQQMELMAVIRLMEEIVGRPARLCLEPVAKGDVRHTSADISKAGQELGFAPKTELRQGLALELAWLKEVYDL